ncbi:MAG: phenylacetate--CoA ligase family protein [Thermoplasmatales archaeon]|nr:phenylacetate--CoA ligase family protein [Thermoplasmatales archaeon]
MSSFLNPIFLLRIVKSYYTDVNRIWKINNEQLKKYQDKCLRKIVKYAYNVPIYHKKYKKAGIYPNDIRGIKDIEKLPFITKDDLKNNFPDGIIPPGFNKDKNPLLSTSGSMGKPVFVYYDQFTAIKALAGYVRALKAYGGIWNKTKIAQIIDSKPGTIENTVFNSDFSSFLKKFVSLKNIKILYVGEKIEDIIKELEIFKPECIGSDPVMLQQLAQLKNNGYGKNINPNLMFSSSAMLDDYTKKFVEKTFGTKLYDVYATTEAGPIAFECKKRGVYHVNSDFVYIEFLDEKNDPVPYGKSGNVIVTKLYGKGTPIIRYTGLEDVATPVESETKCGILSQSIKCIGGRAMDQIILPSGKTVAPFHVTTIPASVMDDFKSYKIKQFQIIQHKVDDIEVLIVIDENLRKTGPSVEKIIEEIKKRFEQKTGEGVKIRVNEVDEISKGVRSDYVRLVISKIKSPINKC